MKYCAVHLASFVYLFLWLPGESVGCCTGAQAPNENKTQDILLISGQSWIIPFTLTEKEVQIPFENWKSKSGKKMARGDLLWLDNMQGRISAPEVGNYLVYGECHCNERSKTFTCFKNNSLSMWTSRALAIHNGIPWCDWACLINIVAWDFFWVKSLQKKKQFLQRL